MGVFDRVLLALFAAFFGLITVLATFVLGGWTTPVSLIELAMDNTQWRWGMIALLIVLFLASVRLVIVSLHKEVAPNNVIQDNPLGQVHISNEAIENMVIKVGKQVAGVQDVKPRVVLADDGVRIAVKVTLLSEVKIPEVSRQLQETIQEYLTESAGISLQAVKVLVTNITGDVKVKSRLD